jgi:hypothetical protein
MAHRPGPGKLISRLSYEVERSLSGFAFPKRDRPYRPDLMRLFVIKRGSSGLTRRFVFA